MLLAASHMLLAASHLLLALQRVFSELARVHVPSAEARLAALDLPPEMLSQQWFLCVYVAARRSHMFKYCGLDRIR